MEEKKSKHPSPLAKLCALEKIDNDLLEVFEVAAIIAKVEGKDYVSTTTFVQALQHCCPGKISDLFQKLPPETLPDPAKIEVTDGENGRALLNNLDSFSPCINSALRSLVPKSKGKRKLSSEDVFDIARYSGGKSTGLLRSNGVTKAKVESLVADLGWELIERDEEFLD